MERGLLRHAVRPERLDPVRAGAARGSGPIHWAGTETASQWAGYMEGAIRSGERGAAEVRAALAGQDARTT